MKHAIVATCMVLALCGCDRASSSRWHAMYVAEVKAHYQTQQIKNAEIAARDMEVENQRAFMAILADRIKDLEKSNERLREEVHERKAQRRGPVPSCVGVVTAVASEIGAVVLDVGSDQGLIEGDEFEIARDGKKIARVKLDRVDRKWSAAKVVGEGTPLKGDQATLISK
jgi:hypothetical protein